MKAIKTFTYTALAGLLAASALTSCLKEFTPTNGATQDQVNEADKSGLVNATAAYLNTYTTDDSYDIGFMQNFIWRDASTCDMPVYDTNYSYFSYVEQCTYLGPLWQFSYLFWTRYYGLVQKANLAIKAVDVEKYPDDAAPAATALAYRANAYMEMAQWYEYKKTGMGDLDQKAEASKIMGLTVPIVTEATTEAESRNNPRAPFYTLYRFILSDLDRAEEYSRGRQEPSEKTNAGYGVACGLKARLWLLIGTRFDLHPEDLSTALSHEDDADIPYVKLGVSTARECFAKAAEYARKAISTGYTPVTDAQWFDPANGFNSVNASWMWANIINTNDGLASSLSWQSWVSYMSPEATYGVAYTNDKGLYGAYRMIDSRLFSQISDKDWRKTTWIAPEDVRNQEAFNTKYAKGTSLGYTEWCNYDAYCGFKYHPAQGDRTTSTVGNAVSMPMMRVEEMYLIEAEATGRAQGDAAGRALLESFVNSFRYTDGSYKSRGVGIEGFIDDVFTQKRIEFWGEGLIMWDYKRLEKAITRGYPGTNFAAATRYNSLPDHVAPWTTLSIPKMEHDYNPACILNPDPSSEGQYAEWQE